MTASSAPARSQRHMPAHETVETTHARVRFGPRTGLLLDLALLAVVLAAAVVAGARFMSAGPPTFVTPDSDDYLWPGFALASGLGFEPELRRTPLYPLFIAGALKLGGNLWSLAVAQHALGVVTAALAYGLGRAAFGGWTGRFVGA